MTVVFFLATLVWLLHAWRAVQVFRTGRFVFSRTLESVSALGVSVALAAIAAAELAHVRSLAWIWVEVALTGGVAAVFMVTHLHAFRTQRFVRSFWADFAKFCCAMIALMIVLMILAVRLYDLAPFGALMVGVLSFFIPVNGMAEVFHEGMKSPHRRRGQE